MNLPFFKKKEKIEYFLALLLREEKVSAVVFEEISGKVKIVGIHQEYFQTSIEEAPFEEWLDVLDKAISTAESSLPEDIETQKTIFGVKENWVEGSKIKKEYLLKLKKICDTLSLSPIGFMVIHEAIAHLMQKEEGIPISAIIVEVDKKNIAVSLLKAGNILNTKRVKIEKTIPFTTDQALHYFAGYDTLPSRIIIYDGVDESENLSQEFIGHPWSKSLPFLHVPQIRILESGFDAKAVLFGAASQMGFEMLEDEEIKLEKASSSVDNEKIIEEKETIKQSDEKEPDIQSEIKEENQKKDIPKNDFGFILDQDILSKQSAKQEEDLDTEIYVENTVIEEEIKDKEYAIEIEETGYKETKKDKPQTLKAQQSPKKLIKNLTKLMFILPLFKNILIFSFSKLFSIKSVLSFIFLKGGIKIAVPFLVLLILIIAIPIIYFFALKSTVAIELKPKIVEKNSEISFIVEKNSDFTKNIIQGEYVEISKEGSLSAPATGKKEVGEKAKGSVTLYSRLPTEKTLSAGTVIASSNNLDFVLDNDIKLASSSADASSDPTTAKASITAKSIGKEYNLPSNTKFTIGNIPSSSIVAKNETAFSGGSKKEITVVSTEDMNKLALKLPKELEDEAKKEINKQASSDKEIIPLFVNTNVKKEFDKKAGEETPIFTIKGTVTYQAISYKKGELSNFSKSLVSNNIDNLYISTNGIKYELTNLKQKSDKEVLGSFKVKAFLYPKLDEEKIKKDITGKSLEEATKIISSINQVESTDISLSPNLPLLPKFLPRAPQNITIEIKNNE